MVGGETEEKNPLNPPPENADRPSKKRRRSRTRSRRRRSKRARRRSPWKKLIALLNKLKSATVFTIVVGGSLFLYYRLYPINAPENPNLENMRNRMNADGAETP